MTIEAILDRLDKYRQIGEKKYRAPCPVHQGKNLNMMISERSDRSVGVHCFVCGATGMEVVEALGLPVKELFAENSEYVPPRVTSKMRQQEAEDEIVLMIAKNTDEKLSLEDKRRVRLARHRLASISALKND